jgi:hypothetical protein
LFKTTWIGVEKWVPKSGDAGAVENVGGDSGDLYTTLAPASGLLLQPLLTVEKAVIVLSALTATGPVYRMASPPSKE